MSMTGIQDRPSGDGALDGRPPTDEASVTVTTSMTPTTEHAKHWAKLYRTGIASGASSVLSTVSAVSRLYRPRHGSAANFTQVSIGLDQDTNASVRITVEYLDYYTLQY